MLDLTPRTLEILNSGVARPARLVHLLIPGDPQLGNDTHYRLTDAPLPVWNTVDGQIYRPNSGLTGTQQPDNKGEITKDEYTIEFSDTLPLTDSSWLRLLRGARGSRVRVWFVFFAETPNDPNPHTPSNAADPQSFTQPLDVYSGECVRILQDVAEQSGVRTQLVFAGPLETLDEFQTVSMSHDLQTQFSRTDTGLRYQSETRRLYWGKGD